MPAASGDIAEAQPPDDLRTAQESLDNDISTLLTHIEDCTRLLKISQSEQKAENEKPSTPVVETILSQRLKVTMRQKRKIQIAISELQDIKRELFKIEGDPANHNSVSIPSGSS